MQDYQIMWGFTATFGALALVRDLKWLRVIYGTAAMVMVGLELFNGGHPL